LRKIASTNGIRLFEFRFEDEDDSPKTTKQALYDPVEETSPLNSQGLEIEEEAPLSLSKSKSKNFEPLEIEAPTATLPQINDF